MHVLGFESVATPRGETHIVEYAASHAESQMATTRAPVKHLMPHPEDSGKESDPELLFRWEKIFKPAYDAWLKGSALPEHGTALASWSVLTASQLKALQSAGLRSIEDLAGANDAIAGKVRMVGFQTLKEQAKRFLDASDVSAVVQRMDQKDAQIAELMAAVEALQAEKPKRGRPKKEVVIDDAGNNSA